MYYPLEFYCIPSAPNLILNQYYPFYWTPVTLPDQPNQTTSYIPPRQERQHIDFYQLFKQKLINRRPTFIKKVWKEDQDQLLISLFDMNFSWQQISHRIPKTNPQICKRRYIKLEQKEPKWTKEQDESIKAMKQNQKKSWTDISCVIKGHTLKQIRQRYENYLRDGISLQAWSIQQDMQIIKYVRENGKKWKKLSKLIPQRTQIQLKNRYYGTLQPIQKRLQGNDNSTQR